MDSVHNTTVNSYIKEIEGYLNNKRIIYEAEGRREFVPLIDRTVQMIRLIKDPGTTEGHSNVTEQNTSNNRSSTQRNFERPPEKMYHYADGEAIDCAICIEQVEPKQAQVRLSCGHIYHLNCLGSHFNHSGDFKCPYCRLEVENYAKQPRTWEFPPNGPPTPQNLNDHNDMSHPGELDFANFQRGVLQVVNSIFGGRLNLGHPFRDDTGAEDDYLDDDDENSDFSDSDRIVYEITNAGDHYNNSESDSDDDSNSSDDDYGQNDPINNDDNRIRSNFNSDSSENSTSGRRARLVMHASNSRIEDSSSVTRDNDRENQGNRSSQERHVRERRSRSPSISHQRSDPINSTRINYNTYYSDRNSNNNLNSIKDHEVGESSNRMDRNRPVNFLDDLQISDTTDSSRYRNDDSRNIKSTINDFSRYHNDNICGETPRNYEQFNQSSLDSSSNVRNDGTFYNNANNRLSFNSSLSQSIFNTPQHSTQQHSTLSSQHNRSHYGSQSDSESEFTNTLCRHKSASFRLRNMYQEDSTTAEEVMDDTGSSSSSPENSDDDQDEDEVMFTGTFNWDAGNEMDTTDDDTEDDDYRRCFSRRSSSSSCSPTFSSSDEGDDEDNISTASLSSPIRNETHQSWYKPWSWYNNNNNISGTASSAADVDSDATISSGDECGH
ncbi:DNA repair protein rad8 [Gigaspora margarita]|uniref:DNA repair protein rad8 n=1 Tax=Gigaspora margarita TaxID=4874 RepID=A0A8H4EPF5_GIGMA|nr:DNA repair protein rad8 [Gigaspora margarita]